jgi:hypothetical protein
VAEAGGAEVRSLKAPVLPAPVQPKIDPEREELIVQMRVRILAGARNGIAGALPNLVRNLSDQTVGNVLRPSLGRSASKRSRPTAWKHFIAARMGVLADLCLFTAEVLTWVRSGNVLSYAGHRRPTRDRTIGHGRPEINALLV